MHLKLLELLSVGKTENPLCGLGASHCAVVVHGQERTNVGTPAGLERLGSLGPLTAHRWLDGTPRLTASATESQRHSVPGGSA